MKRYLLIALLTALLLTFLSHGYAQNYELRGNLRQWIKVFNELPNDTDVMETQLKLELLSALSNNAALKAVSYNVYNGLDNTNDLYFQEAFLDYYSKYIDVRFGKQVFAWGKADEINPTDVLNAQKLTNIAEDKSIRKLGLYSVKTDLKLFDYVLEAVWLPQFESMQLPSMNSKWAFFTIPGLTELPEPSYPENEIESTQWAFKLSKTISSLDLSISYFDGWDNIYTPQLSFNPETHLMQLDNLVFHRTKMIGADFASGISTVGIWGEGAYFITEDSEGENPMIKNPYIQCVLGIDHTFDWSVKANVQYFQEFITKVDNDAEDDAEEAITSKLGIGIPLQQSLTTRIQKSFGSGDVHKVEILGIYDIKDEGFMFQPKLILSPIDAVSFELGSILYSGEEESIFGRFDNNDEMYIKCAYSF